VHTQGVFVCQPKSYCRTSSAGGEYGSALQAASWRNFDRILYPLLSHGADVNAQSEYRVLKLTKEDSIRLLSFHSGGKHGAPLQAAAYHGDLRILHALLERGASVNALSKCFPLTYMIHSPNCETGGKYGSALQAASYQSNTAVVDILIKHGADVNAQGSSFVPRYITSLDDRYRW
jgi:ankyrin repeat protein